MDALRNRLVTTISAVLGVVCLSPATGFATGVCYSFTNADPVFARTSDGGPPLVLRYISTSVGPLNTDAEATKYAHLKQQAYSLVGKATALIDFSCDGVDAAVACPTSINGQQVRLMTTIDGTIITGKQLTTAPLSPHTPGAHMGINMHLLRRLPNFEFIPVGPVTLECSSSQVSPYPNTWLCNIRAEFDIPVKEDSIFWQFAKNHTIVLTKVYTGDSPACSVFQDGEPEVLVY
mgnify:CR=1 FL=1